MSTQIRSHLRGPRLLPTPVPFTCHVRLTDPSTRRASRYRPGVPDPSPSLRGHDPLGSGRAGDWGGGVDMPPPLQRLGGSLGWGGRHATPTATAGSPRPKPPSKDAWIAQRIRPQVLEGRSHSDPDSGTLSVQVRSHLRNSADTPPSSGSGPGCRLSSVLLGRGPCTLGPCPPGTMVDDGRCPLSFRTLPLLGGARCQDSRDFTGVPGTTGSPRHRWFQGLGSHGEEWESGSKAFVGGTP